MQHKEYKINGTNGYNTGIELEGGDVRIVDFSSYDAAYIPLSQIDELINILQEIKQTARIKMDDSVYQQKVTAPFYHKDGFVFDANHRSKYETNYF